MHLLPLVLAAAVILALAGSTLAFPSRVYGIDVSQPVSTDSMRCLVNLNLTYTVVRAWHSTGRPDTNAPGTVAAAWAGGMHDVDVYMFCGNPQGQVQDLHTFLSEHNVRFGMVWLDIEGPGLYWGHDLDANAQFIQDLISEARAVGFHLGMYTSLSQYPGIVGSGTFASDLPLWYADYDGVPSFDDFRPFNGWSHPAIKQFSDAGSKCGASYDINWYPA
ncbi:lysozyme [Thecamonas trahens ATCC 50062]|uniref:Lysozyme n=1 Tax=Thecamonas trahens ATCC 50062 TaxID=461836 RepID=A0A0L0DD13_THETB|nr:lysozyme [Thecamonas trahens ATCC 50062]KNC50224.1 lysozyme [Thecamonas trahens ATCC 50062]|eukprot:XP_013757057.1 lysozyme [Thecamonas trahens ATCC 50062]